MKIERIWVMLPLLLTLALGVWLLSPLGGVSAQGAPPEAAVEAGGGVDGSAGAPPAALPDGATDGHGIEEKTWARVQKQIDRVFGTLVGYMGSVLFFRVPVPGYAPPEPVENGATPVGGIPVIVLTLALGGVFFTFRYGFVNLRLFKHSIYVIRGHFDDEHDRGEVSHFQALTSALAATVGLGNIAGVALAVTTGGPGAVFWMWMMALFGMTSKYSCCTLAQLYRRVGPDGHVLGGPMVYLKDGLAEIRIFGLSMAPLGAVFSPLFAILTIGAAFGGGNMFQSNQTHRIASEVLGFEDERGFALTIGLVLAAFVGVVIIGGIKRIGEVSCRMVPAMCGGYCVICLLLIVTNLDHVPHMFASIFQGAFSSDALFGGFLGTMVTGMQRAAFSNEAGIGSAAIAHAAARTEEPVREGVVALLEPFIDTIIVCTMTALAILITETHLTAQGMEGVTIMARTFESLHHVLDYFLLAAVIIFAYTTMLGWGYYGERATEWLSGGNNKAMWAYRFVYVGVAAIAPMLSLSAVVDFADMMLLSMAFPNIIGMVLLSGKVKALQDDYIRRLKSGEMRPLR